MNNKLVTIIKEVYRKNVRSWAFFFMVFLPIIMTLIMGGIGYYINKEKSETSVGKISVINADNKIKNSLKEFEPKNDYIFDETVDTAKKSLLDGKIDGYLVVNKDGSKYSPLYYKKPTSKDISLGKIVNAFESLQLTELTSSLGLNDNQINEIKNNKVKVNTIKVEVDDKGGLKETNSNNIFDNFKMVFAYAVCFIVFMFIMNYISIISQEIAAEKGSRLMEIILSSVSATTHFFGKMIGIILVIITQIIIYTGIFKIVSFVVRKYNLLKGFNFGENINLGMLFSSVRYEMTICIIYTITGILIYTAIAGFLGSLVSKTEDVQKMITPLTFVGLAGFYIGMYALTSPNSPLVKVSSQIPFFTPFVMPFRLAAGTVPRWEIIISIIFSIVFMILALWISAVFYKSNVLTYSDKGLINNFKRSYQLWKSEKDVN